MSRSRSVGGSRDHLSGRRRACSLLIRFISLFRNISFVVGPERSLRCRPICLVSRSDTIKTPRWPSRLRAVPDTHDTAASPLEPADGPDALAARAARRR